jgi:L-ascorbate metabolism protein UlaG (beta-lactamase superfamily)
MIKLKRMKITWHGQSCFKLVVKVNNGEKITILIDPFDKEIGLNPPRGSADIVIVSHDHHDHNNVKTVSGEPFIVDGPGEYDIKKIFIRGIYSFHDDKKGEERGINTISVIEAEEMKICHLGDLGQKELSDKQLEKIGEVDILMIPVGGTYTINGSEAVKIINQIEPKMVIPMHYKIPGLNLKLNPVEKFLEEIGGEKEKVEEFSIQKKDLIEEEMKVIVMKSL